MSSHKTIDPFAHLEDIKTFLAVGFVTFCIHHHEVMRAGAAVAPRDHHCHQERVHPSGRISRTALKTWSRGGCGLSLKVNIVASEPPISLSKDPARFANDLVAQSLCRSGC